uniref:Uncharacterized protein n=1 Tax=Trichobilharzia regenti TaxID=157069 RepID=A0AA85JJQ9_TRIRE|nr:unnamed protein product [Trichobilharzia regenti]
MDETEETSPLPLTTKDLPKTLLFPYSQNMKRRFHGTEKKLQIKVYIPLSICLLDKNKSQNISRSSTQSNFRNSIHLKKDRLLLTINSLFSCSAFFLIKNRYLYI